MYIFNHFGHCTWYYVITFDVVKQAWLEGVNLCIAGSLWLRKIWLWGYWLQGIWLWEFWECWLWGLWGLQQWDGGGVTCVICFRVMTTTIKASKCWLKHRNYTTGLKGTETIYEMHEITQAPKPKWHISSGHLDFNHPWLLWELTNQSTENTLNTLTHLQNPAAALPCQWGSYLVSSKYCNDWLKAVAMSLMRRTLQSGGWVTWWGTVWCWMLKSVSNQALKLQGMWWNMLARQHWDHNEGKLKMKKQAGSLLESNFQSVLSWPWPVQMKPPVLAWILW